MAVMMNDANTAGMCSRCYTVADGGCFMGSGSGTAMSRSGLDGGCACHIFTAVPASSVVTVQMHFRVWR